MPALRGKSTDGTVSVRYAPTVSSVENSGGVTKRSGTDLATGSCDSVYRVEPHQQGAFERRGAAVMFLHCGIARRSTNTVRDSVVHTEKLL